MNESFEKYQDKINCNIRKSAKSVPKQFLNILNRCSEIENVILNLYNDKSSGLDNVTNEYLKNTV